MRRRQRLASLLTASLIMGLAGCADNSTNLTDNPDHAQGAADSYGAFGGDTRTSLRDTHHDKAGLALQKPHQANIPATSAIGALQKSNTLYNLTMTGEDTGYRWGFVNGVFTMQRTMDGGAQWFPITLPTPWTLAQLSAGSGQLENPGVEVVDPESVYVFGLIGKNLLALHTSDGGHHWSTKSLSLDQSGMQIESVNMVGNQHGWILLRGGTKPSFYRLENNATEFYPLKVQNGGTRTTGLPASAQAVVRFTNSNDGWLVATTSDGLLHFYMSHNGGDTWAGKTLPPPQGLKGWKAVRVFQPVILEKEGSFLVRYERITNGKAQMRIGTFRSIDGGAHFKSWFSDELDDATADYSGTPAHFINSDYGWTINDQRLMATWDGGFTWRTIHSSSLESILHAYPRVLSMDFMSDTFGWMLLQTGDYKRTALVKVTVNGTFTWADAKVMGP
ncbi:WD40/YVTN/BNR-like repeat-containing protein [Alicyclobacillus dauci]|uniref:Photosynthesis system II assembly factor Ycf48/Hcf136-like domain-containing protein n=1 Tax=Alicyclobacillus dauci TaxID=1475485 RepID=A0ABY6ZAA0_9BACL|nr:hypothetical protein [Alicyclobacillus dauci]WAH39453.1 hypothetical protein NZD86_23450 [Alicyclobacillus dauci]